jgi:hypothetical protein
MTVYVVVEQWPYREVACFRTLEDAENFKRNCTLAIPIIISHIYRG